MRLCETSFTSNCCCVSPKDDHVTTLYTPWTTPSVTVARNSYMHAQNRPCMPTVHKSEVEILNVLKLPQDVQGNGRFATVSQGRLQTSDGS